MKKMSLLLVLATISSAAAGQHVDARLTEIEKAAASPAEGQDHLAIAARAEALSRDLARRGQNEPAARALRYAGVLTMMAEEPARAIPLFDRSAALCRSANDQACLGRALNNSAVALQGTDNLVGSLARFRQAAAAFASAGDAELAANTRVNAANVQLVLGDSRGALEVYRVVERDYPRSTFALGLKTNMAAALLDLGRLADADRSANAALALAQRAEARASYLADMRIVNLGTLAESAARRSDRAAALARLGEAQSLAQKGEERDRFNAALACLEVHARLGSTPSTRACAETVERLRWMEDEGTQARALHLAANAFASLGDERRATALQRLAYEAVAEKRRAELASAAAAAVADVGMTERDTLVYTVQGERDAERATADRLRLFGAALFGALAVGMIALVAWMRGRQHRRRKEAVFDERIRVARDLHDTALQGFNALTMQLQAAARTTEGTGGAASSDLLAGLARDAQASLGQVRTAVWQMRSPLSASGDLKAAVIDWIKTRRDDRTNIKIELNDIAAQLGQNSAEALLRVIQEAVSNAAIHGEASQIIVSGTASDGHIRIIISDDGKGFTPTDAAAMGGHWGLLGMRERVEALGGTLNIESAPGQGTRITATVAI
jgi:signal transduction histidine kinase